ncbi:ABC transporter permease subunit [Actinomadura sp. J1-007]|nr:ABC transporter permease subunit [Actinomadura sp. J1-007]
MWTLLSGVVVSVGLSVLLALVTANQFDSMKARDRAEFDPTSNALAGLNLGVVAFGVLGVLAITSEYASGLIRTCLAAVARRSHYLAAKALTVGVVVLVVGEVVSLVSFGLGQAVFDGKGIAAGLTDPGVTRAVLGAGVYLAATALLGLALGALLRHTAGAVTTLLGLLFVLPVIGSFLPGDLGETVNKLLPSNAGSAVMSATTADGSLSPWTGLGVFCLYLAAVLAAAFWRLRTTDV